jgi:phosphoribosylglycinamide formyltransferase-1
MKKIVIFASGSGSNAENIITYFSKDKNISFPCILSNKEDAFVKVRAEKLGVPFKYFTKDEWKNGDILRFLQEIKPDLIVLAGFLLRVPAEIISSFPEKIINIHPSLLPKHGGKGMYGMHVHEAVVADGDKESGISIHYVNENLDEGAIIFQAKCEVLPSDTPEDVAGKVHELEYKFFPEVIERLI